MSRLTGDKSGCPRHLVVEIASVLERDARPRANSFRVLARDYDASRHEQGFDRLLFAPLISRLTGTQKVTRLCQSRSKVTCT